MSPQELFTPPLPQPNPKLRAYVEGWLTLAPVLTKLTQEEVMVCLMYEARGPKRKVMLTRLTSRYAKLEAKRLLNKFSK